MMSELEREQLQEAESLLQKVSEALMEKTSPCVAGCSCRADMARETRESRRRGRPEPRPVQAIIRDAEHDAKLLRQRRQRAVDQDHERIRYDSGVPFKSYFILVHCKSDMIVAYFVIHFIIVNVRKNYLAHPSFSRFQLFATNFVYEYTLIRIRPA